MIIYIPYLLDYTCSIIYLFINGDKLYHE